MKTSFINGMKTALLLTSALLSGIGTAQTPSQKDIHLEAATRNTGGDSFLKNWTRDRYCMYIDNPALLAKIRQERAPVPLMQIFDDVWFIGYQNVGQFILKNEQGFTLVDTLNNTSDVNTQTYPALQSLGIAPGGLKGVYLTHGHGDHDGGANRLRQLFGNDFPIFMGSGDVAGKTYAPTPVSSDTLAYQSISLGGRPLTIISSPGHTPGTMSGFIPVTENGKQHLLLIVGGTAIPTNIAASNSYLQSVQRMYAASMELGAVGTFHPHNSIDGGNQHMADIAARGRNPNPYILGKEKLLRTVAIMRECAAAQVTQVDATAVVPVWRVTSLEFGAQSPAPNRLSARLFSDWGPVAGQTVTFSVKDTGAACTATTGSDGVATCATLPQLRPRDEVVASFSGQTTADYVDLPSTRSSLVNRLSCDIDGDARVDRTDISAISAAIGKPVPAGDARDADGDGKVTVNDARMCTLRCTKPQCAP